jgi:hypothetical protein
MRIAGSKFEAALLSGALSLGLSAFPAFAQNIDLGGDFLVGLPQDEFRDSINEEGYGFSGHFGYFIGHTPIMIGVDFGYLNYGTEKRWEPFSDTIPDVIVEVRTTNNILMLHGFARVQPQEGAIRPYVEGLWGFKYLFTRTSIEEEVFNQPIASYTNFDDLAGSWGLGAGFDIRLWESWPMPPKGGVFDVSLNLSARYLWGSEAEYLKKGSIRQNPGGGVTYELLRSKTNMLIPQVGIRLRF